MYIEKARLARFPLQIMTEPDYKFQENVGMPIPASWRLPPSPLKPQNMSLPPLAALVKQYRAEPRKWCYFAGYQIANLRNPQNTCVTMGNLVNFA